VKVEIRSLRLITKPTFASIITAFHFQQYGQVMLLGAAGLLHERGDCNSWPSLKAVEDIREQSDPMCHLVCILGSKFPAKVVKLKAQYTTF